MADTVLERLRKLASRKSARIYIEYDMLGGAVESRDDITEETRQLLEVANLAQQQQDWLEHTDGPYSDASRMALRPLLEEAKESRHE